MTSEFSSGDIGVYRDPRARDAEYPVVYKTLRSSGVYLEGWYEPVSGTYRADPDSARVRLAMRADGSRVSDSGSGDRLLPASSERPSGPGDTADRIPD